MATTYNNLYMDIRQELHRAGIEGATLEARELVAFAAGKTRQELLRDGRLYVPQEVEQRAASLVARHLEGEPLAYLIGEWSFCGMDLDIDENVLIPRVDTEVLAEQAVSFVKTLAEPRVLDLCAGSGCVGLAVAKLCPRQPCGAGRADGGCAAGLPPQHPPHWPDGAGTALASKCP